ncbi:MAG: ankyrin repeat domain-containing protein, partial [Cytophagales bacterium]
SENTTSQRNEHKEKIEKLYSNYCNKNNKTGFPALHALILSDNEEENKLGRQIVTTRFFGEKNQHLSYAFSKLSPEDIRLKDVLYRFNILIGNEDVNTTRAGGRSILQWVAWAIDDWEDHELIQIFQTLITHYGADINMQDKNEQTALFSVTERPQLVDYFLKNGGNPYIKDDKGNTCLYTAIRGKDILSIKKICNFTRKKELQKTTKIMSYWAKNNKIHHWPVVLNLLVSERIGNAFLQIKNNDGLTAVMYNEKKLIRFKERIKEAKENNNQKEISYSCTKKAKSKMIRTLLETSEKMIRV